MQGWTLDFHTACNHLSVLWCTLGKKNKEVNKCLYTKNRLILSLKSIKIPTRIILSKLLECLKGVLDKAFKTNKHQRGTISIFIYFVYNTEFKH